MTSPLGIDSPSHFFSWYAPPPFDFTNLGTLEPISFLEEREAPQAASSSSSAIPSRKRAPELLPDSSDELKRAKTDLAIIEQRVISHIKPSADEIAYHLQFWARENNWEIVSAIHSKFSLFIQSDLSLLELLGSCYYENEEGEKALECFDCAFCMNPSSRSLLYFRAKILGSQGDCKGVGEAVIQISHKSDSTPTRYLGAHLGFLQGDLSISMPLIRSLSTELPYSLHVRFLAEKILDQINTQLEISSDPRTLQMQKEIEELLAQAPTPLTPEIIQRLSRDEDPAYLLSFWMREANSEMVTALAGALSEKISTNLKALSLLATYFYEENNPESALPFLQQAIKLENASLYLFYMLAKVHILAHRYDEAEFPLEVLREEAPRSLPNIYLKALMSLEKENFKDVLLYFRMLSDQIPFSTRLKQLLKEAIEELESKASRSSEEEVILNDLKSL